MVKITRIYQNEYRDSLFLMKLSDDVSSWKDVNQAVIVMGTESNKSILAQLGLLDGIGQGATAHDLVVAIEGFPGLVEADFLNALEARMTESQIESGSSKSFANLKTALAARPDSSLVFLSVPGQYAASLADQALDDGNHVFCFSQHMTIEDEISLKTKAIKQDLLMMGPDCGTACLDGVGIGFANQVRKGAVGIVSAAGSGLQEVMSLIDRAGGGISQAIGVGGRDMTEQVGGLMAAAAVERIGRLPETKVIAILAKKASQKAKIRVLEAAMEIDLPVIVNFAADDSQSEPQESGVIYTDTFEDCAREALKLTGFSWDALEDSGTVRRAWMDVQLARLPSARQKIRGLFGGGSLCAEAKSIFEKRGFDLSTNLEGPLHDQTSSNVLLDLGAEEYTQGSAHPFIDPRSRLIEIEKAWKDLQVGVLLLDVVLGWGCHPDPAAALTQIIDRLRANNDRGPALIASICGTGADFQNFNRQAEVLQKAGFYIAPSNAAAVYLAVDFMAKLKGEKQ